MYTVSEQESMQISNNDVTVGACDDTVSVIISYLNVKNLQSNYFNYLLYRELANKISVTFLCETWLRKNEINHFLDFSYQNIPANSDIPDNYTVGRPFGGQAWIVLKNYTILEYKFISIRQLAIFI